MTITDVTIEAVSPQPTAVMRSIRTTPQIEPWTSAAFEQIAEYVAARGVDTSGAPFVRYHHRGEGLYEVEAGYPCTEPITGNGKIEASTLPGGAAACTVLGGSLEGIATAHEALRTWVEDHGGRISGDPWSIRLSSQEANGLRTRVVQPFEGVCGPAKPSSPRPARFGTRKRVNDVMSAFVVTARPSTPLSELVELMTRWQISGVPITDDQSRLVGIVTEADLISKPAFGGEHRRLLGVLSDLVHGRGSTWTRKAQGLTAADVMTTRLETAAPDETIQMAARRMIQCGVKRLPVVDDDRLVGIVARPDVLRAMHRTDKDLAHDIKAVLDDPLRLPDASTVDVSVVRGVVTLEGTVQYPVDVEVLSSIVWRFPGVMAVVNNVVATEPNPEPPRVSDLLDDTDYLRYMR